MSGHSQKEYFEFQNFEIFQNLKNVLKFQINLLQKYRYFKNYVKNKLLDLNKRFYYQN